MKRTFIIVAILINLTALSFISKQVVTLSERNFNLSQKNYEIEIKFNKKINRLYSMIQKTPVGNYIEVDKDLIAFTENLAEDFDRTAILYILTKKNTEITINKVYRNEEKSQVSSFSVSGEDFEGIFFNTINGFEKASFRKFELSLGTPLNCWYEIDIFRDGSLVQTIPYLVRPQKINNEIAFVANTNTMVAYLDNLEIRSNYVNRLHLPGPYTRPHTYPYNYSISRAKLGCDHFPGADKFYHIWMLDHSLEFDIIDDDILLNFSRIRDYKTIVFGVHDEYWDPRTFFNIKKFVDNGGNLILLGGNTAYRVMENRNAYKIVTNNFTSKDKLLFEYIKEYVGVFYTDSGYKSFAPYQVKAPDHILMQGIANIFGKHSLNTCSNKEQDGASGWETDKLIDGAAGFTLLAKGMNNNHGGADLVYKEFKSGGKIINFGSLSLVGSLDDPNVNKLLENIFEHFGHKLTYD
jgi:hypothetical protein